MPRRLHFVPARVYFVRLLLAAACSIAPAAAASAQTPDAEESSGDRARALVSEATELRVTVESMADLGRVIELCQEALAEEGIPDEVRAYAEEMLFGAYFERGMRTVQGLIAAAQQGGMRQSDYQRQRRMAASDLVHARDLEPDVPALQLAIARVEALAGGDRVAALKAVERAIDLSEDDAQKSEAYTLRAGLQETPEKALADLDTALKLNEENVDALQARALLHIQQEEFDLAAEDFGRAVEIDPENLQQLGAYAGALFINEDFAKALEIYDRLAEAAPDNPALVFRRGQILARLERYDEAIAQFDRVLEEQSDEPQVLLEKADVLIKLGRFLDAANVIHQLIAAAPDNPGLRLEAARLYLAGERPSKSLEMLNELAATESDSWQVFRLRADAHLNLAQHAEAIRDYDRVLELNPDDAETLNNLAWLLATSPNDELRDADRAIKIAVKACELTDYSAPHILSTLAAGYAERGDFETAVRWSREAVALEEQEATEEDDIVEQLRGELQSYLDRKPWREMLEVDEQDADETAVPPRVLGPNDA